MKVAIGVVTVVALGGAWTVNRLFLSCVWMARDVASLPLRGHVRSSSCESKGFASSGTLSFDSAGMATTVAEARQSPLYRSIDDPPDSSLRIPIATLRQFVGAHGLYWVSPAKPDGGFANVFINVAQRYLIVQSSPN